MVGVVQCIPPIRLAAGFHFQRAETDRIVHAIHCGGDRPSVRLEVKARPEAGVGRRTGLEGRDAAGHQEGVPVETQIGLWRKFKLAPCSLKLVPITGPCRSFCWAAAFAGNY